MVISERERERERERESSLMHDRRKEIQYM